MRRPVRATPHSAVGGESIGDLVRAAAQHDDAAWCELLRRFNGMVMGIAYSHRLNDADAADASQVVWLRLFDHLDRIRDPDRIAGWLATTTRRECLGILRQRDRVTPMAEGDVFDRGGYGCDPVAGLACQEQAIALRSLIQTLPKGQQRLLEMLMDDPQPSYREVSETLAIPVGSIGPTRQRCLARLRDECVSAGIDPVLA
jgi:RNA polymerase sigma factor (sigma-70 family)